MKISDLNESIADRFAQQYEVRPSGCWHWTGAFDGRGYGRLRNGSNSSGKRASAHRVSLVLATGEVPDNMLVCHHCDNPSCVNPDHLYIGTSLQNNRDRVMRGRSNTAFGVRVGSSKLTPKMVQEIIRIYNLPGESQYSVAACFGISQAIVSRIVSGKIWAKSGNSGTKAKSRGRKGEQASASKITQAIADAIKLRKGSASQIAIAEEFGVSQQLVSLIFSGKVW